MSDKLKILDGATVPYVRPVYENIEGYPCKMEIEGVDEKMRIRFKCKKCGLHSSVSPDFIPCPSQSYWDFMRDGKTPHSRKRAIEQDKDLFRDGQAIEKEIFEEERSEEWDVYLAGSLRNEDIPRLVSIIELQTHRSVFADWFAAGPEADDYWKRYYSELGHTYRQALSKPASKNTFEFDKRHMEKSKTMVLVLPAGKSGHLELGWFLGQGKPGYILLDGETDRWDVMYQFANGVTDDVYELAEWLKYQTS